MSFRGSFTLNNRCEIFGPVLAVGRFTTEEEAIELANDTSYGLGAGLHSSGSRACFNVRAPWNVSSNRVPPLHFFSGRKPVHARFISTRSWNRE